MATSTTTAGVQQNPAPCPTTVTLTSNNLIASGIFTLVYRISETRVRKVPRGDDAENIQGVQNEANIYALLGDDDHVARCVSIGQSVDYVDLEWAVHGALDEYVRKIEPQLTTSLLSRLGRTVVECVGVLHRHNVIHSDLALRQFLVYEDGLPRISDFTASGYPGHPALGMENASHFMPRSFHELNSVQSDLFALGSTLYELMEGDVPYSGKTDEETEELYEGGNFPCTKGLLCGDVILGCWTRRFQSVDEVLAAYDRSVARYSHLGFV